MPSQRETEALVGHVGFILLIGLFAASVMVSLLGFVDLKDATTATFAGTALGYTGAKVEAAMRRYYGGKDPDRGKPDNGAS